MNKTVINTGISMQKETLFTEDDIDKLIIKLNTSDYNLKEKIKEELIKIATHSDSARSIIIDKLMLNIDYKDMRSFSSQKDYELWESSIDILGELKAKEAIKYFVQCLDCGYRFSESYSGFPAYKATVKLGEDSVPLLSNSLFDSRKNVRIMSIVALTEIGGVQAKISLQSALASEQDDYVQDLITNSLLQMK
jgi:HEAT repeat protein